MKGTILLCNQDFANIVSAQTREELINQTLYKLFEGKASHRLLAEVSTVLHGGNSNFEISIEKDTTNVLYRVTLCSFEDTETKAIQGVVGHLRDITEFRKNAITNQKMQQGITNVLVRAIESVDPYLAGHSAMMQDLGALLVKHLDLGDEDAQTIDLAAKLSQIGKLYLPRELWLKSESLTEEERLQLQQAPVFAYDILTDIHSNLPIAEAVFTINERLDGSGYPRGLRGDAINIHSRVLAVLHAFSAMHSARAWRESMDTDQALDILRQSPAFDQKIVAAFEAVLNTEVAAYIIQQKKGKEQIPNPKDMLF